MDDVTPRDLMEDASRIGGWLRELRQLEWEEELLMRRFTDERGPLDKDADKTFASLQIIKRVQEERPELVDRIHFLSREVQAALARGRLVEMAAVAERWVV